ncbi:hypothetical protein E4T85_20685 [Bacillus stratosphericus]|nr:hypothetical protein E4T85_20685 [Bacillus stratosphericus]
MRKLYSPNVTAWAATAAECFQTAGSRCKIEKTLTKFIGRYRLCKPAAPIPSRQPAKHLASRHGFAAFHLNFCFSDGLQRLEPAYGIGKGLRRYGVESFIGVTALLSLV